MSQDRPTRENEIPLAGVFLLFLGIVFLLQTMDILSWRLWERLWRFWPMLLIVTGLSFLLRRYNIWLVSLIILVLLFASLGMANWLPPRILY